MHKQKNKEYHYYSAPLKKQKFNYFWERKIFLYIDIIFYIDTLYYNHNLHNKFLSLSFFSHFKQKYEK